MEYLIVCPLALVAGLVDAVAGGGGLISLPAYFFAGLPPHAAIATNKLSSTMGTTLATIRYAQFGYMVRDFVVIGVACGLLGSSFGAYLALQVSTVVFMLFMLISLPFIAGFVLKIRNLDSFSQQAWNHRKSCILTGFIACGVGIYDGFYGPGTGTFLMLLLTAVAHRSTKEAAGTTKAINLATNIAALSVFLVNGAVLIPLGLAAGIFNIAGNWIGTRLFRQKGTQILRPFMIIVILLFAVRLVLDLAGIL